MTSRITPAGRIRLTLLCVLLAFAAAASLAPAAQAYFFWYPGITGVRPVEGAGEMTQSFLSTGQPRTYTYTSEFSPARIDPGEDFAFEGKLTMNDPPPLCVPDARTVNLGEGSFGVGGRHGEPFSNHALPGVSYWALGDLIYVKPLMTEDITIKSCAGETTEISWSVAVDGSENEQMPETCFYHLMDDDSNFGRWTPGDSGNAGTVAVLAVGDADCTTEACNDNIDEDNDGYDGYPGDPGCTSSSDVSENDFGLACDDGIDNDLDDSADFRQAISDPDDPDADESGRDAECESPTDPSEEIDECSDDLDNDEDGLTDHPFDPGCSSEGDASEHSPALECDDGLDNDGDSKIDFQLPVPADLSPPDPGCESVFDASEKEAQCADGYTNDKDDLADYPADPGCTSPTDDNEYDEVELTVEVEGPGALFGCETRCVHAIERGERLALYAIPVERIDGIDRVDGCDVRVVERCEIRMNHSRTVSASFNPVITYAPSIRFAKGEKYWPMDPNEFVAKSALKWTNIHGARTKPCSLATHLKARYGRVNPLKLGSGGYTHRYCWHPPKRRGFLKAKERRTFTSRELTSPSFEQKPGTALGRSGFFLDLDDRALLGKKPQGDVGPPMHVEYKPRRYIIYWFFYGKNSADVKHVKDRHEGDWEHIVVGLDQHNRADAIAYYAHYCTNERYRWSQLRSKKGFLLEGEHPAVWVAKGSHASYPDKGFDVVAGNCMSPFKGILDSRTKGVRWRTWKQGLGGFRRAEFQPWYGFGGGWGDIADSTASFPGPFWGPLGPGPLKMKEAVPTGW
jgi:hypothetical protein